MYFIQQQKEPFDSPVLKYAVYKYRFLAGHTIPVQGFCSLWQDGTFEKAFSNTKGPVAKCSFQAKTENRHIKKVLENCRIKQFSRTFYPCNFFKILFCNRLFFHVQIYRSGCSSRTRTACKYVTAGKAARRRNRRLR